jgi:hypothetical protein
MSLGLKSFRNAAVGMSMLGVLAPSSADALTPDQCRGLTGLATLHLKAAGKNAVSPEFTGSFIGYVTSAVDCSGKAEIIVSRLKDLAVWQAIEDSGKRNGANVAAEVRIVAHSGAEPAVRDYVQKFYAKRPTLSAISSPPKALGK